MDKDLKESLWLNAGIQVRGDLLLICPTIAATGHHGLSSIRLLSPLMTRIIIIPLQVGVPVEVHDARPEQLAFQVISSFLPLM